MDQPSFDYSKLKGRITEKCGTQKKFAKLVKMSPATLISKLSGKTFFNQNDILRSVSVLDIEPAAISTYFFTKRVQ